MGMFPAFGYGANNTFHFDIGRPYSGIDSTIPKDIKLPDPKSKKRKTKSKKKKKSIK